MALNALELAAATAAELGEARVTLARVEDALQRRAVLYDKAGRPPLRLHLRLDQGHARVRSGRVALLPGGDARGRRGPAVHRPADGDPRLRGHRQRRSRRAVGGHGGGAGGRARRDARGALRARPGGHLPLSRAEVERRRTCARPRRRLTCASTARRPCRAGCGRARGPGQQTGGYDYPHERPGHLSPQELLPGGRRGRALLRARRGGGASWRRRSSEIRRARGAEGR